jgi:hypothetical protein
MKFKALVPGHERRPFRLCLPNAVFPEHKLTFANDRLDRVGGKGFRDGDERDARRISPGFAACPRDFLAHARQSIRLCAFHVLTNRADR